MSEDRAITSASSDTSRAAIRLGADYLVRSLALLTDYFDGQMITGIVAMGLNQANVAHLSRRDQPETYASSDIVPPDDVRRPISILALSANLGLPYETTRRHVEKLVQMGICVRNKGGVLVRAQALDNDAHRQLMTAHLSSLRRFLRELAAAGVDLGPSVSK